MANPLRYLKNKAKIKISEDILPEIFYIPKTEEIKFILDNNDISFTKEGKKIIKKINNERKENKEKFDIKIKNVRINNNKKLLKNINNKNITYNNYIKKNHKYQNNNSNSYKFNDYIIKYKISLYILLCLFGNINSHFNYYSYEITLKVKGIGTKNILSSSSSFIYPCPSKIYLNRKLISNIEDCHYIDIIELNSEIKIEWNNITIFSTKKMFYNCKEIIKIDMTKFDTSLVSDMSYMFSSCDSLKSLNVSNLNTAKVQTMEYMFYNCKNLISINLESFRVPKVVSLYRMFYNCINLEYININNFEDKENVNIAGIFYNIASNAVICLPSCLPPTNFIIKSLTTSKVIVTWKGNHWNKYIISYGLNRLSNPDGGTKINVKKKDNYTFTNLNYGTGYDIYIKSDCTTKTSDWVGPLSTPGSYNMPNTGTYSIYTCSKLIYDSGGSNRNYSNGDYGILKIYPETSGKLISIKGTVDCESGWDYLYIYDGEGTSGTCLGCYSGVYTIPLLVSTSGPLTIKFTTDNSVVRAGFKLNVSCLNTQSANTNANTYYLTKSNNCQTISCDNDWRNVQNKMISGTATCIEDCKTTNTKYQYQGKCYNTCPFNTTSINYICYSNSVLEKCQLYSNYSNYENLCIKCKNGYYPMLNDQSNIYPYINCYKNLEGYYLDTYDSFYKPCYISCKTCNIKGNEEIHNCITCFLNYTYEFNIQNYRNCYYKCKYYFYNDITTNKNYCTEEGECPIEYNKFIYNNNQCTEDCKKDDIYKYEYKKQCLPNCPSNTELYEDIDYYCIPQCSEEYLFIMIGSQECINYCTIIELSNKICRINNHIKNTTSMINYIIKEIENINLDIAYVYSGENIIIEEKYIHSIITVNNLVEIEECENILRYYYNIENDEKILKLKIEYIENRENLNQDYKLFFTFNDTYLQQLDISICYCNEPKCSLCSNTSIKYDLCISCNENYYPIINDSSNIYSYINCYQNPEGYYLDTNDSFYKPCYDSYKTCEIKGDEEIHNCISCDDEYIYEFPFEIYRNCYKKCEYYFYYDNITNKNYCIEKPECPIKYYKLRIENNQCIKDCKMDKLYKYEFKNNCYSNCPNNTELYEFIDYYCVPQCSQENPFAIIKSQECFKYCTIDELLKKICKFSYSKNNIKYMSNYIINEIEKENFNETDIYDGTHILVEKYATFTITTNNLTEINECENILRSYYKINSNKKILKFKTEYIENKITSNAEYNLFFKFNDTYFQQLDLTICSCQRPKCSLCSNTSLKYDLCISCNKNYHPILNDPSNMFSYINCYQNPEGYYLDTNNSFYKPCYHSCKTCDIKGAEEIHNCISCNDNYIYELPFEIYKNCYKKCEHYFYYDKKINKYYCTKELKCPIEYNKLRIEKNECIEDCKMDELYKYEFQKKCYSKCPNNTELSTLKDYYCNIKCPKEYPFEIVSSQKCVKNCSISDRQKKLCITNYESDQKESAKVQDEAIKNIREDLTSGFDTSEIESGGDIVIEEKGTKLTITSTENQKNSEKDTNSTTINLGECENELKKHYNISLDKSLYILKLDVVQEGMKIPKIEYEVYYPLNGKNLEKLNLSTCDNSKVDISIPVEINEDLDKLNPSSAYYNDICYTSTSENGIDISLSDRKKEFVDNNKTLCEEDCEFIKYDYETGKAVCSCNIKNNIASVSEATIDKSKFFSGFTDLNNIINYKIMKCIKNIFELESFKHNYGSFILFPLIVFHIVSIIISLVSGNKLIKNQIEEIIMAKQDFKFVESQYNKYLEIQKLKEKLEDEENNKKKNEKDEITIKKKSTKKRKDYIHIHPFMKYLKKMNIYINKNSPPIKYKKRNFQINLKNNSTNKTLKSQNSEILIKTPIIINEKNLNADEILLENVKKYKKYKALLNYNQNELNSLSYKEALKSDKRTFCQYYFSLLRVKHLFFFAFIPVNDYNIKIIKVDLLLISTSMDYTINALFFNDDTMHQIYEDGGKFNFFYQIPQIIYSSLISFFIYSILESLALTEDNVIEIKQLKETKNLLIMKKKMFRIMKIKFIFFTLLSSLIYVIFFYYVACFCAIYRNTQMHLFKDSLISFAISLVYPFLFCFLPGIFRIPSLYINENKRRILYNFSKIFHIC